MISPLQAIEALETWRTARGPLRTTGFADLDELTGGFEPGQVWVVIANPSQGRSTLATQWALLLATQHGLRTHMVSGRDSVTDLAARLVASVSKVPFTHLRSREGLGLFDEDAFERARRLLSTAPLQLGGPGDLTTVSTDLEVEDWPEAIVIDDAHLATGIHQRVSEFARRGLVVVLTFPRVHVITRETLDQPWADVADVVLEIERPDHYHYEYLRSGEADFHVIRNRMGPYRTIAVGFQGHYARFVDGPR